MHENSVPFSKSKFDWTSTQWSILLSSIPNGWPQTQLRQPKCRILTDYAIHFFILCWECAIPASFTHVHLSIDSESKVCCNRHSLWRIGVLELRTFRFTMIRRSALTSSPHASWRWNQQVIWPHPRYRGSNYRVNVLWCYTWTMTEENELQPVDRPSSGKQRMILNTNLLCRVRSSRKKRSRKCLREETHSWNIKCLMLDDV